MLEEIEAQSAKKKEVLKRAKGKKKKSEQLYQGAFDMDKPF
jgi:hypothetical protein